MCFKEADFAELLSLRLEDVKHSFCPLQNFYVMQWLGDVEVSELRPMSFPRR